VTGPESVEVSWTPPQRPNGVVTGYELRRDGEVVYVGAATLYHDFLLRPNARYSYVVAANNSRGAVSSAAVAVTTHPSAPSGVGPPTLRPLGPSQVRGHRPAAPGVGLGCVALALSIKYRRHESSSGVPVRASLVPESSQIEGRALRDVQNRGLLLLYYSKVSALINGHRYLQSSRHGFG
jgi:hypothetical protein